MDLKVLDAQYKKVMRGYFLNEREEKILVHVPTTQFFSLHTLTPANMDLGEHMNLQGFFELAP